MTSTKLQFLDDLSGNDLNYDADDHQLLSDHFKRVERTPKSQGRLKYTLTYVIKKGYFNLVRCLLSFGVDPNKADDKETLQRTPLIYCTFIRDHQWSITVARNLLEHGASLKKTDSRRLTPIHYCCAFGKHDLLELFLNSLDFDLDKSVDQNGNSCLHYAVRSHNLKCVRLLIDKLKTSHMTSHIDVPNKFGLRASQIKEDFDQPPKLNTTYSGLDSLDSCLKELNDFVKHLNEKKFNEMLKKQQLLQQQQQLQEQQQQQLLLKQADSKNESKKLKKRKKGSANVAAKKNTTKKSPPPSGGTKVETIFESQSMNDSKFINQSILSFDKFFKTQIEPSQLLPTTAAKNSTNSTVNRSKSIFVPKVAHNTSNFNHQTFTRKESLVNLASSNFNFDQLFINKVPSFFAPI